VKITDKVLSELVESWFRQKPIPKTAVVFKMKLKSAINYCKESGLEIPAYDAHIASRTKDHK
jgi:hypothetical protein